jgi:anti-sigma factor (TIGR02949 family)
MTQTRFGDQACQKLRARLDSYIDNELLTESNLEMMEHFGRCLPCTQEAQERQNVRKRLQTAVRDVKAPPGLEGRVRDRLRQATQPKPKKLFLMAAAAALAICFGVFRFHNSVGPILRIAFDDHLHCAVIHHAAIHGAGEANQLPDQLKGLTGIVRERVPAELALIVAHECKDQGRRFIHLTFGDDQHLLSVVITRREEGESIGGGTRQSVRDHFQLAAFETSEFFVYTVSDLPAEVNANVLTRLSTSVENFLTQFEG